MKNRSKIIKINLIMLSMILMACLLCSFIFNTNIIETIKIKDSLKQNGEVGTFDIRVKSSYTHNGSVSIDWKDYNYTNKNFKVYKSSDGTNYESVGIDYTLVSQVKVLQIYPNSSVTQQLKDWMETNGYGKGIIKVDSVYFDTFSSDPATYLKDSGGNWKYDVIMFGTWDSNGSKKQLSTTAYTYVEQFIKSGRGVIFGHDSLFENASQTGNLNSFASYVNIKVDTSWSYGTDLGSSKVKIVKKGLLTNYPWEIGDVGDELTIPWTHTGAQIAEGDIWLQISPHRNSDGRNFYITTYNNCAMIQTGHSNGQATDDEQKILANLIFYMNQLIFDTYTSKDSSAQDFASPNAPDIDIQKNYINFSATDNGTKYWYYVESFDKDDSTETGLIDRSQVKTIEVTTEVVKYKYILDDNPDTVVTETTGVEIEDESIPYTDQYKYIHVAAIDGAGNLGETSTVGIDTEHDVIFKNNGETVLAQIVPHGGAATAPDNLSIPGYTLSWDKDFSNVQEDLEINAIWTPNDDTPYTVEYYLQDKDMEVEGYQLYETETKVGTTDTTVTLQGQNIKAINGFTYNPSNYRNVTSGNINGEGTLVLKLYYTRNSYNIIYELNGGEASGLTTSYLYGKEFILPKNIKKTGFKFAGWYEKSNFTGDPITSIDDTRTGDITIYAKWIENNGLKGDLNLDGKVTLLDLSLMNQAIVGKATLVDQPKLNADINDDQKITLIDLSLINQIIVGKVTF